MKSLIDLCFLQLLITLVCIETRGSTSLRNHRVENLREVESRRKRQQSNVSVRSVKEYVANGTRTLADGTVGVKKWTIDQNNGHLVVNNGGKASKKCRGKSCLWNETALSINTKQNVIMEEKLHRNRRTGSLFLAKALDMLDHSRPRDAWNFANRMSSNTPFKLHNFTSKLNKPNHDNNVRMKKPVKNRPGEKRQQWSKPTSGMRPRFFFNTAPAEFVEGPKKRKPSPVPQFEHGAIHISVPPGGGPPRPPHMHRMEGVFPGHNNHMHMMKNAEHFPQFPVSDPFANPPLPFHSPLHHSPLHRFDQSPYAVHINAPPRLEPPMSPDNLAQQMPQSDSPIRTEPPPAAFNMMPPPEVHNEPFPPIDAPGIHPPGDIPPMLPFTELHNMPPEMPGPPIPPLDMQGMPPPGDIQPMFPPPEVQRVPVPVPVPSPPKIEHVPYPVPVPGRPSIQQVMVPVAVPSPPKIHEVAVPVESPPKIKNVPVPVPVAVPSPPMIKHVPYPVAVPVRGPPEVQKIFYPVAVPQPSQVHHVPYPVYIRYPPEIRRVPYPVLSPPKPFPVPVPSPPRVMINRVPYPVMVSQKVPYPVPIVVQHHHIHEDEGNYEESDSPEDPNNMITNSHSIDIDDQYDHPETVNTGQCIVNLCRNGGTCSAYMNAYRCHCPKGYKGKHCEEQDMCRPNPCRNFGACSEVEHDYECTCTKGFIGKNCDKPDPCVPSPCDNGATCSSDGTTYSCTCRIGWMGKNCQVESKCLPINPCQNGGTCTETLGTYKCDCTPGWRGLSCEISAPETLSESPSNTPAAAPCDNCQGPDDVSLDQRNTLRHHSQSSKKWTVAKRKKENKG